MERVFDGDLPSAAPEASERVDGRRQRSARTRQSIVEAYLALLRENPRLPTAEAVAEQAGLSERAVFSHFSDLRALGIAAFDYVLTNRQPSLASDAKGDRQTRIASLVEARARSSENWLPLWRVVMQRYLGSAEIKQRVDAVHELVEARIEGMFLDELSELTVEDRQATINAIATMTNFESWNRLREHYKLSRSDACAAWLKVVGRLLPPTPAQPSTTP